MIYVVIKTNLVLAIKRTSSPNTFDDRIIHRNVRMDYMPSSYQEQRLQRRETAIGAGWNQLRHWHVLLMYHKDFLVVP